jgi:hypothetical protein
MELIWNSGSTLYFANAAVIRITFDFLQAAARSVEKARRMPFCEESEESMQSTDNEEHKSGERADVRPRTGGAHVEPRAWCQLLGRIWTSLRRCAGAEKFRELIDDCKVFSRSGRYEGRSQATLSQNKRRMAGEPVSRILCGAQFAKRTAYRGDHSSRSRFAP